jgi:carotenoid 9,10(9',10')-cleavage dioxygenase 1
VDLI